VIEEPEPESPGFQTFIGKCEFQGDFGGPRQTLSAAQLLQGMTLPPYFTYTTHTATPQLAFFGQRNGTEQFRTELRHADEWPAAIGTNVMHIRLSISDSELNEYTWAQIHRKAAVSVPPPLRLTWDKQRSGIAQHLWAVVRRDSGSYERYDLGPRVEGFMDVRIELTDLTLTVTIDGTVRHSQTLADWAGYNTCYFKYGLYLTGSASSGGSVDCVVESVDAYNSIITNVHSV